MYSRWLMPRSRRTLGLAAACLIASLAPLGTRDIAMGSTVILTEIPVIKA